MEDLTLRINMILLSCFMFSTLLLVAVILIRYLLISIKCTKKTGLKFKKQDEATGIILGRLGKFVLYSPEYAEGHALVLGSSGSAKTTSVLLPSLHSWPNGLFAIDISGDISSTINNNNSKLKTIIYDPSNPESRVIYNPFHLIDQIQIRALTLEALEKLSYILLPDVASEDSAKWFDAGGRDIITAALICFYDLSYDFQQICYELINNDYAKLFAKIDNSKNQDAIRYINQFQGMSERNISGCFQSAQKAVQVFVSPILENKLRRPHTISDTILTPESIENSHIYMIIPDSKKEQYAKLVELVSSQILDYINIRPSHKINKKVLIAIDEYASFKTLDLSQPLAKSRKKGCRIMILCQNLNQISRNFGEYAMKEIVDNCDLNIICNISEPSSQRYFSDKAGTKQTFMQTEIINKPIYKPEDFGKLRKTNIILVRGENIKLFKNYYWKYYKNS